MRDADGKLNTSNCCKLCSYSIGIMQLSLMISPFEQAAMCYCCCHMYPIENYSEEYPYGRIERPFQCFAFSPECKAIFMEEICKSTADMIAEETCGPICLPPCD